ncbi:hypothetical protein CDD83_9813 [Cordyceps sp. RAO-2017]|nr:hypothetical protein CDD83_9813 [Cordyceps sp. RAO-2017]
MALRPTVASLACCGCRSAVLRAVLGHGIRSLAQPPRPLPASPASQRWLGLDHGPTSSPARDEAEDASAAKPWFLDVEPPRHAPSPHTPELPKTPDDAPPLLEPMIEYVYQDMGLDDIALLDLRDLDPPAALGPNLIMLFATARSERHLHISSGRFVRWLRRNYKVDARADGLIGPGELKTKLRRLRKKAKLMGTNTMMAPEGDHGLSTGWVCVNFSAADRDAGETENFDESGRFSGFGAVQTGMTIVVQCMTESRRRDLDLESLWERKLRNSLERGRSLRGEAADPAGLNATMSSRVQLPSSRSESPWQAMLRASQQQRAFSASARRLEGQPPEIPARKKRVSRFTEDELEDKGGLSEKPAHETSVSSFAQNESEDILDGPAAQAHVGEDGLENVEHGLQSVEDGPATQKQPGVDGLEHVEHGLRDVEDGPAIQTQTGEDELAGLQQHLENMRTRKMPLDQPTLEALVAAVLRVESPRPGTALDRLALVDQLLLTGHERGMAVDGSDMLVTLIESMATSPAHDAVMARAQRNMELVLREKQVAPTEGHTLRLMKAHAQRRDWDRFWDAFRTPARFQSPRSAAVYELAFRSMAATQDARMCREALRWTYLDMLREEPPVPVAAVYRSLRACIVAADPAVEMNLDPAVADTGNELLRRRLLRSETLTMLKHATALQRDHMAVRARVEEAAARSRLSSELAPPPGPA